jgi:hypothetical protein
VDNDLNVQELYLSVVLVYDYMATLAKVHFICGGWPVKEPLNTIVLKLSSILVLKITITTN